MLKYKDLLVLINKHPVKEEWPFLFLNVTHLSSLAASA